MYRIFGVNSTQQASKQRKQPRRDASCPLGSDLARERRSIIDRGVLQRCGTLLGCLMVLILVSQSVAQEPPQFGEAPPSVEDSFNTLPAFGTSDDGDLFGAKAEFSGTFQVSEATRVGELTIHAAIQPHWHIYSTTQPTGGPKPTEISVVESPDFRLTGDFVSNRDPEIQSDPAFPGVRIEQFSHEVTWTAPIVLAENVNAESLAIPIVLNALACETGGQCELISDEPVTARFAGYTAASESARLFKGADAHVTITGHVEPKVAVAGETVHLVLSAALSSDWHVYHYAPTDPQKIAKPTLILLRKTAGWKYGDVVASVKPKEEESGLEEEPILYYHEGRVSWTIPIHVPQDARPGDYDIAGGIGFQTCTPTSCDQPAAADFRTTVTVGERSERGTVALSFTATRYDKIAKEAAAIAGARKSGAKSDVSTSSTTGTWAKKSVLTVLGLAFLAGLLLNVMPCVLPVIGLKVMSFVQQAGGSRREILVLNLWFSFGLMSVFWILAAAAAFANHTWGTHFGDMRFLVAMIGIVFAFGLSFLGVWEIPIPGFVGSGKVQGAAEKEGAVGAFSKGVLSTVLATPCAGPLLVPAVSWATMQPSWLTFLTFTSIGLGMAAPYLLIGIAPQLTRLLPKPGPWMDTFKQAMGFLLLATVVFLFISVPQQYVISTLTLLLGIGIACWWIGRTPMTADFATKLRGWTASVTVIVLAAALGFIVLVPQSEIAWQPFSRVMLDEHLRDGHTVLVDFTADW